MHTGPHTLRLVLAVRECGHLDRAASIAGLPTAELAEMVHGDRATPFWLPQAISRGYREAVEQANPARRARGSRYLKGGSIVPFLA